ncbi:MAG: hypothetical protein Q9203_003944 [Teloschistes exilis]
MVQRSDEIGPVNQSCSSIEAAHASQNLSDAGSQGLEPLNDKTSHHSQDVDPSGRSRFSSRAARKVKVVVNDPKSQEVSEKSNQISSPEVPPPPETVHGEAPTTIESTEKPNLLIRFCRDCKKILFGSWINTLLVFVPVGIAVHLAHVSPTIVFAMNAIAIIPLAALLAHATQSVAIEMGDTIGALLNITFGNAVELIIFMYVKIWIADKKEPEASPTRRQQLDCALNTYPSAVVIALVKNEIRIVQASLLGSILANLLLILGMCFLFGGLRFREQIYNSTVTQVSVCLLSLSVMSLLLPTAFHASFTDNGTADHAVLKILLLVYVLYLLFQLKSHAYLYTSTPQHVIDEESHPGVLADMLHSSSSSSSGNSSSSSDTDGSSRSNTTAKRIKRVLRGRGGRKSSLSSKETPSAPSTTRTASASTFGQSLDNNETTVGDSSGSASPQLGVIASGDEADTDGESHRRHQRYQDKTIKYRDFEEDKPVSKHAKSPPHGKAKKHYQTGQPLRQKLQPVDDSNQIPASHGNRVQTLPKANNMPEESVRRAFGRRGISNVLPTMPAMPHILSTTVFSAANPTGLPTVGPPPTAATTSPLHRSTSLPSRLNRMEGNRPNTAPTQTVPYMRPVATIHPTFDAKGSNHPKKKLSRTSALLLLLTSTGLVAVCAEFLVSSIHYLVDHTNISQAFIGLIILPIVGNAAEHVTAVIAASRNKMDLAIGVAVGSSIQIALFITPVIVLFGWILQKDMSLYFSLFETISLFVSAFIINFLILDGKTNYLEGALLIAAYVIIALAAFFYPDSSQQSMVGGAEDKMKLLRMIPHHEFPTVLIPLPHTTSLSRGGDILQSDIPHQIGPPEENASPSSPRPQPSQPPPSVIAPTTSESSSPPHPPSNNPTAVSPPAGTLPPQLLSLVNSIKSTLLASFASAPPHTAQRLAELILRPQSHYRTLPSYLRAIDRVVSVSSPTTVFPLPLSTPAGLNGSGYLNGSITPADTNSSDVDPDEMLGGAALTPIPWLRDTLAMGSVERERMVGSDLRRESTSVIDGPNGVGSVETVTVANMNANTRQVGAAVTQGELIRQEQEAGVVPVPMSRNSTMPPSVANNADETDVEDGEAVIPHARGPEEIGMEDMGPQSSSTAGFDVEAALGRKGEGEGPPLQKPPEESGEKEVEKDKDGEGDIEVVDADGNTEGEERKSESVGQNVGSDAGDGTTL